MKKILITGGSGFIGRHILTALPAEHYQIHALSTQIIPHDLYPNIIWHQVDIHHTKEIDAVIRDIAPSYLIHSAWYTKPVEYWTSPLNYDWLNSSLHLLKSFIEMGGKRAVMIGSCAEYDWQHKHCIEQKTPCVPHTVYGKAKHQLQIESEALAKKYGLSLAWARIFYLFGPNEHPQRLIPATIKNLMRQQIVNIKSGTQIRDFMYVADVANALVALLESPVTGPINIASGQARSIKELIMLIAKKLKAESLVNFASETNIVSYDSEVRADVKRLSTEVGWQPQFALDTALDNAIEWWSKN